MKCNMVQRILAYRKSENGVPSREDFEFLLNEVKNTNDIARLEFFMPYNGVHYVSIDKNSDIDELIDTYSNRVYPV